MTARKALTCLLAVAAGALAGCGSDLDKTGKPVAGKPVVLTLVTHSGNPAQVQAWADAVERLSGNSVRIRISTHWRPSETSFDRATLRDVRTGRVPLAAVAARAYDELGVTSFQPLVAPLLIDSRELERRVLRDDVSRRALAGVERLGLVGLALLPTELRRPFGISRRLAGPGDYRGARIWVREGNVAQATFEALGARAVHGPSEAWFRSVDAADTSPGPVRDDARELARRAPGFPSNVVLWPHPLTIVMNRKAFDRLSDAQRRAIRDAARAAFDTESRLVAQSAHDAEQDLCAVGTRPVPANPGQRAALVAAVEPVYRMIERGPGNPAALARIHELKGNSGPDTLACTRTQTPSPPTHRPAHQLEGTYRASFSKQELADSPLLDAGEINDENWGDLTLRFTLDGKFRISVHNRVSEGSQSGTYRTSGDKLVLNVAETGETFAYRWSLYRGTLKFERDEKLGVGPTPWLVKPWRRVR
jgi:TRAP-type C4-dicarboxylate transport system substrate-binding protein